MAQVNDRLSKAAMQVKLPNVTEEQIEAICAGEGQPVVTSRLVWLTVHCAVCLVLRQPQVTGDVREVLVEFTRQLGDGLVSWGVLTSKGVRRIERALGAGHRS